MPAANRAHLLHVFHRHWLPTAGVVGHRQHYQGNALAAHVADQIFQLLHVHVSFEWMFQAGLTPFGNDEIHGLGAHKLHVRARCIKVRIVRNDVALLAGDRERIRSAARPWCVGITCL